MLMPRKSPKIFQCIIHSPASQSSVCVDVAISGRIIGAKDDASDPCKTEVLIIAILRNVRCDVVGNPRN